MGTRTGVEARDKSIRLFFVLDGVHRRETLRVNGEPVLPTPANLKFANRLAAEIRAKISAGVFVLHEYFPASASATVGRGLTVGDQLDSWLSSLRVAKSTLRGYRVAANFWRGQLGDKPLRGLRHSDILKAIATKAELNGKTINNYTAVLSQALQLAVLDKVIAENPAAAVPTATSQRPPIEPFSKDEAERIIAAVAERHDPQVANLVEAWMFTGMRTSEIFGLKWDAVSLAAGTLVVSGALIDGDEKDTTKTGVARTVRLNSRALAAIERQRALTQLQGGYVFRDPRTGKAWSTAATFQKVFWSPILRKLGIPLRRPYNMRHTYATMMLMAGMRPAFCAKQLGHSVEMFLGTYTKWIDGEADDGEMARLEASMTSLRIPANRDDSQSHL